MRSKKLIITLAAVMLVTFAAAPSVNANPLIITAIPVFLVMTGISLLAVDIHNTNADHQSNEAVADDSFRDNGMISKGENRWAD